MTFIISASANAQKESCGDLSWNPAAVLPGRGDKEALGVAGPVAGWSGEVFMTGGGANFPLALPWEGGKKAYYDALHLFKRDGRGGLKYFRTCTLPDTVGYAACASTSRGLVYAGGESERGLSDEVFLLRWNDEKEQLSCEALPSLPEPVTNASLTLMGSRIYLAGGETAAGASDQWLCLDLEATQKEWTRLPALPKAVSHAVLVVQTDGKGDKIFLAGGRRRKPDGISELYASVHAFDPVKGVWTGKAPLPYALSAGTGAAVGAHYFYLFGGDRGETFHRTEVLIAAIAKEEDSVKKEALNHEKIKLQSGHPGFSRELLLYDTVKDHWTACGALPFETPVTTTAVTWKGEIYLPSGEIKAGVRTPLIWKTQLKEPLRH